MVQLDLFEAENIQNLRDEIEKLNKSTAAVRRGLFARNTSLEKYAVELEERIEELDREIYKLKQYVYGTGQLKELERVM